MRSHNEAQTHYEVLGVPQNASEEEIKRAYKSLAKELHPDKNPGQEARMMQVNDAYSILGNREKRDDYDAELAANTHEEPMPEERTETLETDWHEAFKREFPGCYAAIDKEKVSDWKKEYDKYDKENYNLINGTFTKNLVKAFKLRDPEYCADLAKNFLETVIHYQQNPLEKLTLIMWGYDGSPALNITQWINKHRPDVAKELNDVIYHNLVLPACANDPKSLLVWSIKTDQDLSVIAQHNAFIEDPYVVASCMHWALKLQNLAAAELLLKGRDVSAVLSHASGETMTFVLTKLSDEQIRAHFYKMSKEGNSNNIEWLLENKVSITPDDWKAACTADKCLQTNYEIVDSFLKHGDTVPASLLQSGEVKDPDMLSYLLIKSNSFKPDNINDEFIKACLQENSKLAAILLKNGADLNSIDPISGKRATDIIVESCNPELVSALARSNRTIFIPAYHRACEEGNTAAVETLIKEEIFNGYNDVEDIKAMEIACKNGHTEIADMLVIKLADGPGVMPSEVMDRLLNPVDIQAIKTLLSIFNDIKQKMMYTYLFQNCNDDVKGEMFEHLWLNTDSDEYSQRDYLILCYEFGSKNDLERYIGKDAGNSERMTFVLQSALDHAATHMEARPPSTTFINGMLDYGADAKQCTGTLQLACEGGDLALVKRLVESGIDVNDINADFRHTPLIIAMTAKQSDIAKYLIDHGAKLRTLHFDDGVTEDKFHSTSDNQLTHLLRVSLATCNTELAISFIEAGANLVEKNSKGNSALEILFDSDFDYEEKQALAVLMLKHGADGASIVRQTSETDTDNSAVLDVDDKQDLLTDMLQCAISTIEGKALRDELLERFEEKFDPDEHLEKYDPNELYAAIYKLASTINSAESFVEFQRLVTDTNSTPKIIAKIFNIDEAQYNANLPEASRCHQLSELRKVLMANKFDKDHPLTLVCEAIKHPDGASTDELIKKVQSILHENPSALRSHSVFASDTQSPQAANIRPVVDLINALGQDDAQYSHDLATKKVELVKKQFGFNDRAMTLIK